MSSAQVIGNHTWLGSSTVVLANGSFTTAKSSAVNVDIAPCPGNETPTTTSVVVENQVKNVAVMDEKAIYACDEHSQLLPSPLLLSQPPSDSSKIVKFLAAKRCTTTQHRHNVNNNDKHYINNNETSNGNSNNNSNSNNNNSNSTNKATCSNDMSGIKHCCDMSTLGCLDIAAHCGASNAINDRRTAGSQPTSKAAKMTRIGNKPVGLKRVSFGSSKGSMVETLLFETPTPLTEHAEPIFGNIPANKSLPGNTMDDSGIDLQEEVQRSIVRVSIYQSSQPRQVFPADLTSALVDSSQDLVKSFSTDHCCIGGNIMTVAGTMSCDRQQSTDSGWDNPFRPGGDLSREADEIVNMIKGGKPITPTEDLHLSNQLAHDKDHCNEVTTVDGAVKKDMTQMQSVRNGTTTSLQQNQTSSEKATNESNGNTTAGAVAAATTTTTITQAQVSKKVVPGPTSASHIVIDEKKNKKDGCCVVQ